MGLPSDLSKTLDDLSRDESMPNMNTAAESSTGRSQSRRTQLFSYLVAAGFVAAATLVRLLLDPWLGDTLPYITYFPAIVAAAWFGRLGPSLFAVALSCIAVDWFFIPPRHSLTITFQNPGEWLGLFVFTLVGVPFSPRLVNRFIERRQLAVSRAGMVACRSQQHRRRRDRHRCTGRSSTNESGC